MLVGKKTPDWADVESAYRSGMEPLRVIAERNGITHGAINKRAKRDGWVRDLAGKIQAKTEILVSKDAVSKAVSKDAKIAERDLIEANAELQASIIRSQRKDITRARNLVMSLLEEAEFYTANKELMEQLGEIMRSPDEAGLDRAYELFQRAMSHGGRTDTVKKLAEALDKMVNLERRVFNISDGEASEQHVTITEIRLVGVMPPAMVGNTYEHEP